MLNFIYPQIVYYNFYLGKKNAAVEIQIYKMTSSVNSDYLRLPPELTLFN